jgi:biotin carboxyl carrier protein
MTLEVDIDGRSRTVAIEPAGPGRYRISVDGRQFEVEAARTGEFGLSLIVGGDGTVSRELQVAPGGSRGELLVGLEGRTAAVIVNGRRSRRAADGAGHALGEQSIVAPMPGRVVRVLVGPGDAVTAKQGIVVVEAMKMENELRSPKAGTVKSVAVSAGASVEAGRVLAVIE